MLANMAFKRGTDRKHTVLFPESLDEYVAADSPVRLIDAFADSLDMIALGFHRVEPDDIGTDDRQGTRRVLRQGRRAKPGHLPAGRDTTDDGRAGGRDGRMMVRKPRSRARRHCRTDSTRRESSIWKPQLYSRQPSRYCNVRNFKSDFSDSLGEGMT